MAGQASGQGTWVDVADSTRSRGMPMGQVA
jgi:hypothetical protein